MYVFSWALVLDHFCNLNFTNIYIKVRASCLAPVPHILEPTYVRANIKTNA